MTGEVLATVAVRQQQARDTLPYLAVACKAHTCADLRRVQRSSLSRSSVLHVHVHVHVVVQARAEPAVIMELSLLLENLK